MNIVPLTLSAFFELYTPYIYIYIDIDNSKEIVQIFVFRYLNALTLLLDLFSRQN